MNYIKRKRELKQKALTSGCTREELQELYYLITHYGSGNELDELLQSGWYAEQPGVKMSEKTAQEVLGKIRSSIHHKGRRSFLIRRALQIAASICFIALSLFVLKTYYPGSGKTDKITMAAKVEREAGVGKVVKVKLEDGTVVWLNSGSKINYPGNFGENRRVVELLGEAFFDVARDENRPFIIKSGPFTTRVLGTSFNVSAYDNDAYAVTVASGTVKVEHKTGAVLLTRNQQAGFNAYQEKFISKQVSSDLFSDWRFGILHLNGRLSEALKIVERKYGVKVLFEDPQLKTYEIEATYKNESLANVLKSISFSMGVKATVDNDTIKISGKVYN